MPLLSQSLINLHPSLQGGHAYTQYGSHLDQVLPSVHRPQGIYMGTCSNPLGINTVYGKSSYAACQTAPRSCCLQILSCHLIRQSKMMSLGLKYTTLYTSYCPFPSVWIPEPVQKLIASWCRYKGLVPQAAIAHQPPQHKKARDATLKRS